MSQICLAMPEDDGPDLYVNDILEARDLAELNGKYQSLCWEVGRIASHEGTDQPQNPAS
ncbi:MAG TPA: hypothetical protein VK983_00720 [Candidatus Limnocylindrales bacterium]|nr:hypothetical protein [Candidatus Limnocylindrales bacterium]